MTSQEKLNYKNELKQLCHTLIEQRINSARMAMESAQEAANNEEKSSAGDKYETSRAMGHLEKDMHAKQLLQNKKELAILFSVNVNSIYEVGRAGAFLQCTNACFFIAAGLGKQIIEGRTVFFLSPQAPLAKLLESKRIGDSFSMAGTQTCILDIY